MRAIVLSNRTAKGILTILILTPLLVSWTWLTVPCWAESFFSNPDEEIWRRTISLSHQHWWRLGYTQASIRSDQDLSFVKQLTLGQYVTPIRAGLMVTGNRANEGDRFKLGISAYKKLFKTWRIGASYQPLNDNWQYSISGRLHRSVYLSLSYSTYYESWNVGSSYNSSAFGINQGFRDNDRGDPVYTSSVRITFRSGNSSAGGARNRNVSQNREIVWLND